MRDLCGVAEGCINDKKEKIKVTSAEIVVHGTVEKPYYEIKYLVVGEEEYDIGYSSYELKNVFGWLHEYFEVVTDNKTI